MNVSISESYFDHETLNSQPKFPGILGFRVWVGRVLVDGFRGCDLTKSRPSKRSPAFDFPSRNDFPTQNQTEYVANHVQSPSGACRLGVHLCCLPEWL